MNELTKILHAIELGDSQAIDQLLPLIYDELRELAARKMADERPGRTLQTTALVHETYLRLFKNGQTQHWNSRGHFFSAVSEAMRRILIDQSRRRLAAKRGGELERQELCHFEIAVDLPEEEILALSEALDRLEQHDADAAKLVQLRFFGGLSMADAADILGISERSAYNIWAYARAWLKHTLRDD